MTVLSPSYVTTGEKSSMIYAKLRSNKTFNWAISHVLKDLTPEELNKHNEWKQKHNIS